MGLNTALLSMAGAAALAELAVVISPSIGTSVTVPKLAADRFMAIAPQDGRTSVQFHSARTSEVLSWLETHGFSFVVNDGDIAPGKTITLNVENQPVESVANAVAQALGGHWEKSDGIHVFKKGVTALNWMKVPAGSSFMWDGKVPGRSSDNDFDASKLLGPDFQKNLQNQFGPDFQKQFQGQNNMSPEEIKKLQDKIQKQFGPEFQQKLQKQMQDQFGPKFQKQMQDQFGPKFQKQMEDQFGPSFQKKMQDQFGPDFQKKMEDRFKGKNFQQMTPEQQKALQKQMQDQFGPKFQKQMEDQFGPKFQKQMEDQFGPKFQKQMEDLGKKMEVFGKQMEDQFGPKFEKQMEEMSKQIEKQAESNGKMGQMLTRPRMGMNSGKTFAKPDVDGMKLLKSLTPDEKDQMRKQGYIWYNDLTRDQKAMFDSMHGKFEYRFKQDDQEVRIRRN